VDSGLILETTFLIDLERELSRGEDGRAQAFLAEHSAASLHITFTVAGELTAGMPLDVRERWEEFIAPFQVLPCTHDVCWEYGQAYRYLKTNGLLIGANDLWIGSTAVALDQPPVPRNARPVRRIPRLRVMGYG